MLALSICESLYPQYKNTFERLIDRCKNLFGLYVCVYTMYNIYKYNETYDPQYIEQINYLVIFQNIIEIPFVDSSSLIHHGIVLSLAYCKYYVSSVDTTELNKHLLVMEMSTIPLIIRHLINDIHKDQDILRYRFYEYIATIWFTISFFYYRIFYYTENILHNRTFYDQNDDNTVNTVTYVFTYMFYMLNVYWFMKIVKSWIKHLRELMPVSESQRFIDNEWCLQFTSGITWLAACKIYSTNMKIVYMYDVLGLYALSVSSFGYHNAIYKALVKKSPSLKVNTISRSILPYYQFDLSCILMNGFWKAFTNINFWEPDAMHFYVLPINWMFTISKQNMLMFLVGMYSFGIYQSVVFLRDLSRTGTKFYYTETKLDWKFTMINAYVCIPIMISIVLNAMNCTSYELGLQYLTAMYVTILIRVMHVGYEYNHLLFHGSVLWLTVLSCRLNMLE